MKSGDRVRLDQMPLGTWFYDRDGDLNVVVPSDGDELSYQVACRYNGRWNSNNQQPEQRLPPLPTLLGDPNDFGDRINWDKGDVFAVAWTPEPPAPTDDEVAEAMASIMAAIK